MNLYLYYSSSRYDLIILFEEMSRHAYSCWLDSNFYWRLFSILMLYVCCCVCFAGKLNRISLDFPVSQAIQMYFNAHTFSLCVSFFIFHLPLWISQTSVRIKNRKFTWNYSLTHGTNSAEVINNFGIRKGSQNTRSICSNWIRFGTLFNSIHFLKMEKRNGFEQHTLSARILSVRSNGSVTIHAGIYPYQ